MTKTFVTILTLVPALLAAQGTQDSARMVASARYGRTNASMSVDAELALARRRGLPDEPIRRRVAEGRVKGATESQLAIAAHRVRLTMEAAVEAMASGGRTRPSDEEIERGAGAMEQGYTRTQIEAVAKSAPSDRSLVVAFDVLTKLSERGLPVSRALEQVTAKLQARQTDAEIHALLVTRTGWGVTTTPGRATASGNGGLGLSVRKP